MGPRFVTLSAVFYGLLVLAAAVIGAVGGRDVFELGNSPTLGLALGLAAAGLTVPLGIASYKIIPALRDVAAELGPRLVDGAKYRDLIMVSVFSGVGEEALFRGALQPVLGIWLTSLLFGALHVGPDRRYLFWTFWAVGAGLLFGALYEWTGSILAPTVAHVLHNAATLMLWRRSRAAKAGIAP